MPLSVQPALPQPTESGELAVADPPASETQKAYGPPAPEVVAIRGSTPVAIPEPLDLAASLAATSHPSVSSAEAEAKALSAEYRGARWGRFASASVEVLAATSGSTFADEDGLALNATLEQPLWAGGRIGGEIARARANELAGEDRIDEAQRSIILQVVGAYYEYVRADERLGVLQASLTQHNDLLAAIGRRVKQEVSPLADLTLGRSRTAQVELDVATTQELRDSARLRFFALTGGADIKPVIPPPSVVELLPPEEIALIEALSCDPTLAALTDLIGVAEAQRDIAEAQLLPQVAVQLSQNEITGARAALVLRMQFGNGGAQLSAIDASDARVARSLADFDEAQRRVREALRRDYVLARAANARIEVGGLAASAADDIVGSYQRQFIAGRRSWLDVMNAVREAANARLSESDARVAAAAATARIFAQTCRWLPSDPGAAQ